ncbi:MAG: ROK family protein [Kiritimatiellae bacterium]|nr:ROK family protein [Kiritimatiellia bacterium]
MNVIGLDIGGTKCAVVLANTDGKKITILKKKRFATDNRQPAMEIIDQFCSIIDQFTKKTPAEAIGISCGGPLDSRTGVIKRPPNLPMWDDIHICDILSKKYGIPARLQNDANACALAEWMYGAGRGTRNMAFLTFGTGLGAGLILDGRLYCGTNDNGGEFGHIRLSENGPVGYGKVGSFEGFCSGGGIAQLGAMLGLQAFMNGETPAYYNPKTAPVGITAQTIAEAAMKGDKTAKEVYRLSGEYLGRGLSILIDILNPERIVIGSVFKRAKNLLLPSCMKVIEREALPLSRKVCKIVPAALDAELGDFAAVTTAVYTTDK